MRTNAFIRIMSALLALWYILATVGFDIHRSADSQRTYILPMFADLSCESIHPEAPCHYNHGASCHHDEACCHACGCDDDEDCCTDTFEQLSTLSEQASSFEIPALQVNVAVAPASSLESTAFSLERESRDIVPVGISPGPPPDILSSICLLRA